MVDVKPRKFGSGWGLLLIALVVSGIAFWLSIKYLSTKEGILRDQILGEKASTTAYVVAARDLYPGDVLSLETLALGQIADGNVSAFAVKPEEFDQYNGQILRYPMSSGEPLLSHFVAGKGIERFSDLLEKNERAVTLKIDELNSASGMLVAGDYVDILLVLEQDKANFESGSKKLQPLLQNVRILSIDARPLHSKEQDFVIDNNLENTSYSTVTVGVKIEDASKVILARDIGNLVFMLRNNKDHKQLDTELLTQQDLENSAAASSNYQFYSASNSANGVINPTLKQIYFVQHGSQSQTLQLSLPITKNKNKHLPQSKPDETVTVQ
ncbi:MAG: Flp pilus assembly protein CpaB [Gammaproteobacteria bacterium CG22_combo_CG10-13_8_21_14_all_40_8]|nr:MAG: Flp pilus assembly protein CpaB [Gammaproteobacteria bacterium CG22_combo_CG10-13_8_21_14_all_40_8]